jgi:membrane protease YdiL (CAAX protease family)
MPRSPDEVTPHTPSQTVLLHLFPGLCVLGITLAVTPAVIRAGFPPGMGLLLGFLGMGIPIELGLILREARRRNGTFSLRGVLLNREHMPAWQYLAFFVGLFAVALGALALTTPISKYLAEHTFHWLPRYLLPDPETAYPAVSGGAMAAFLLLNLLVDGLLNPVVEELYFRGYLLPRIPATGWSAPLIGAILFSLQHYWQPYHYVLLILIQVPVVFVVWAKRNLYISILAHAFGNTLGAALLILQFAGTAR